MASPTFPPSRPPRATVLPPNPASAATLADADGDALYRELAEAERAHRAEAWWKRFGIAAVALTVCAVLGTAGYVYWGKHREASLRSATTKLFTGNELVKAGRMEEAIALYRYGAAKHRELRPLLRMREAELLSGTGKTAEALAVLREVAATRDLDPAIRDTARLSIARQTGDPEEMRQSLAAAATPGAPFAPLAQQMRAALAMAENNPAEAKADLATIDTKSPSLPKNLRQRTEEMRSVFIANEAAETKPEAMQPASSQHRDVDSPSPTALTKTPTIPPGAKK